MARTLILDRTDGLGSRLLALCRTLRFAREVGAELEMPWRSLNWSQRDPDAPDGRLAALFDKSVLSLPGLHLSEAPPPANWIGEALDHQPDRSDERRFGFDPAGLPFDQGPITVVASKPLRVRGETNEAVRLGTQAAFADLRPSLPIREALTAVAGQIGTAEFVVAHLRRGDVRENARSEARKPNVEPRLNRPMSRVEGRLRAFAQRCAPLAAVCEALAAMPSDLRVLVIGEDAALQAQVETKLALGRAIDTRAAKARLGSIQSALFDIHLLARAKTIIGGQSAFADIGIEAGRANMHRIAPSGESRSWLQMLEVEVLSERGLDERWTAQVRDLFRTEVAALADRNDRLAARRGTVID